MKIIIIAGQTYGVLNSAIIKMIMDTEGLLLLIGLMILLTAVGVGLLTNLVRSVMMNKQVRNANDTDYKKYLDNLTGKQIDRLIRCREKSVRLYRFLLTMGLGLYSILPARAQTNIEMPESLLDSGGIQITIVLIILPLLLIVFLLMTRIIAALRKLRYKMLSAEAEKVSLYLQEAIQDEAVLQQLENRKKQLAFRLNQYELSGQLSPEDSRGLISGIDTDGKLPFVARKKSATRRPKIDPGLASLVIWYILCATFWLLFGTTVGEYAGIKFVAPDADQSAWLSFGRLRPVHTNAVFWGWASLAMLGLGYYVVPRVSNCRLFSLKLGWYSLILINLTVITGTICLMAGINNGGGEYREYIWPVMLMFGVGLMMTLYNFLKTVAMRTTKEIYISNWYIISSVIFALVISIVAYVPWWQNGLGETIIQGYYMHQGVGMWFMLFTLGIVYYFLPQQLNKPVYSYSLGILAFWTQILFYTLIGTHHFVFSAIPWWLQTVAIVGSVGMVIPVVAGTTNFLMTFRGEWGKIGDSYTLPFFLTGILFYFTGSLQGTAEAFRFTNLIWHFTDFTVAHSHLTMYGIICFLVWAGIYAVVPRLTGVEPPQATVGAHFWFALIGLLFYTVPLMYGSTLRGMMWLEGKPFMESVILMKPFWLWRAIGGSLMWVSHLFFAWNLYKMIKPGERLNVKDMAFEKLESAISLQEQKASPDITRM